VIFETHADEFPKDSHCLILNLTKRSGVAKVGRQITSAKRMFHVANSRKRSGGSKMRC